MTQYLIIKLVRLCVRGRRGYPAGSRALVLKPRSSSTGPDPGEGVDYRQDVETGGTPWKDYFVL